MSADLVLTTGADALPEGDGWVTGQLALEPHAAGERWSAIAADLQASSDWQAFDYVLVLAEGVQMSAPAIAETFRVMRQTGVQVAQPSLSWTSHFSDPTALHNPSFVLRHTNRLDTHALVFAKAALERWLPLMRALPGDLALSRLLTLCDEAPTRAAGVIDAVQAVRTLPAAAHESATPAWPPALQAAGPHHEAATNWGGIGLRGQRVGLFDDTREEFLGLLAAGYACAVPEPEPIGTVFLGHFARSLEAPPMPIRLELGAAPARQLRRSPIFDHARQAAQAAANGASE